MSKYILPILLCCCLFAVSTAFSDAKFETAASADHKIAKRGFLFGIFDWMWGKSDNKDGKPNKNDNMVINTAKLDCKISYMIGVKFHGALLAEVEAADSSLCNSLCWRYRELGARCRSFNYDQLKTTCQFMSDAPVTRRDRRVMPDSASINVEVLFCQD